MHQVVVAVDLLIAGHAKKIRSTHMHMHILNHINWLIYASSCLKVVKSMDTHWLPQERNNKAVWKRECCEWENVATRPVAKLFWLHCCWHQDHLQAELQCHVMSCAHWRVMLGNVGKSNAAASPLLRLGSWEKIHQQLGQQQEQFHVCPALVDLEECRSFAWLGTRLGKRWKLYSIIPKCSGHSSLNTFNTIVPRRWWCGWNLQTAPALQETKWGRSLPTWPELSEWSLGKKGAEQAAKNLGFTCTISLQS